jgi:hypothetical protein
MSRRTLAARLVTFYFAESSFAAVTVVFTRIHASTRIADGRLGAVGAGQAFGFGFAAGARGAISVPNLSRRQIHL